MVPIRYRSDHCAVKLGNRPAGQVEAICPLLELSVVVREDGVPPSTHLRITQIESGAGLIFYKTI